MSPIQLQGGAKLIVCGSYTNRTMLSYQHGFVDFTIAALNADQCTELSSALLAEANRQRREAAENVRLRDIHEALRADERGVTA